MSRCPAHGAGLGSDWNAPKVYWTDPTPANRRAPGEWLNFDGVKNTYVGKIPDRLKPLFAPEAWHQDWERMSRPGRVDIQFRIFETFAGHVARFPEISAYHRRHRPPALLLRGRHDPHFEIGKVMAYAGRLDRLDMHIFDGGFSA